MKERLDRVLVNKDWLLHFTDMGVVHLPMLNSDHSPLWVRTGTLLNSPRRPKPFKFMAAWLSHDSFGDLVKDSWSSNNAWGVNVEAFTHAASHWNKTVFGHIQKRKNTLIRRLQGIHRALSNESNLFLEDLQKHLWREYELILFEEESLWAQKSRCRWLMQGDKNTRYFHLSTLARRRRNKVLALKNDEGC